MDDYLSDLLEISRIFTSLSEENLSSNEVLLEESLISEVIRIALSKREHPLHIISLKNWVDRKLRCIIRGYETKDLNKFYNVLREGVGPNMEFIGDVLKLENGYYCPAPTRLIKINDLNWVIISGLPTEYFIDKGLKIKMRGMSRILVDINEEKLQQFDILIQNINSYIGLDGSFNIENCLEGFFKKERVVPFEFDRYMDYYHLKTPYIKWRKNQWEKIPHWVSFNDNKITFCRWNKPFGLNEYWIVTKHKAKKPVFHLVNNHGRKAWSPGEFKYKGIQVPFYLYKTVCLAFDHLEKNVCEARLIKSRGELHVRFNFSPCAPMIQWLHAIGAEWLDFEDGFLSWSVEKYQENNIKELLEKFGIKVITL